MSTSSSARVRAFCARYWPELLAVAAALVFALRIIAHAWFLPPSRVYLGFVQVDQPVYYACAREYVESGNGLFAANPYSNLPDSRRHYSHLYFLLVGWIWRLTGVSFSVIDGGVRVLFGPIMLLLAARIFRFLHGWRRGANPLLALMLLGGGLAWATALFSTTVNVLVGQLNKTPSDSWLSLLWFLFTREFSTAEGGYGDWQVQLFRNLFYSPEICYHILFFGAVLFCMKRAFAAGCVTVFLAWWAHPYTGLEVSLILASWLVVEWARGNRPCLRPFAAIVAINALFALYYGVFLARDPEHRSVYQQMQNFPAVMLLSQIVSAYGLLAPLALAAFLPPRFSEQWKRSEFRLAVVWAVVAALLNYQDKILPRGYGMQPLHFSHGYLYVPLALLATEGLESVLRMWRPLHAERLIVSCAVALFFLHLPDNLIWCTRNVTCLPRTSILFAPPKADIELLNALDKLPTTETVLVDDLPPATSFFVPLIPVLTHHRSVNSHLFNTPFAEEKRQMLDEFRSTPTLELVRRMHATAVLSSPRRAEVLKHALGENVEEIKLGFPHAVLFKVRTHTAEKSE
ncbi:MAG: hypothetical protein ACP5QZ_06410 [Candidatus Sumerlaeaceae bacterium]